MPKKKKKERNEKEKSKETGENDSAVRKRARATSVCDISTKLSSPSGSAYCTRKCVMYVSSYRFVVLVSNLIVALLDYTWFA